MRTNHSIKIRTAIESLVGGRTVSTTNSNAIIRISRGAQLSRGGIVGAWFLMLFLLLFAVVFFIQGTVAVGIVLISFCILIVVYILDYQGIEIDPKTDKIRSYSSFLGYRSGNWHPLHIFTQLRIYQDVFMEMRSEGYMPRTGSHVKHDTHHYYAVYLESTDGNYFIKLYEDESVVRARYFAAKFSGVSELEYSDRIRRSKEESDE